MAMASLPGTGPKPLTNGSPRPDFSGYWRLVKLEGLDSYLKELGYPWVMRKTMIKYGSKATDIVLQKEGFMRITTVNSKASWKRDFVEGKEITQSNAEGTLCRTTAWWDGPVHKSRMETLGDQPQTFESWRYMDAGQMVVKSILAGNEKGRPVDVFWYLEAIEAPELDKASGKSLQKRLSRDQKRVARATEEENGALVKLKQNRRKWETPADRFLSLTASERDLKDPRITSGSTSPRSLSTMSPLSSSPRAAGHGHFSMGNGSMQGFRESGGGGPPHSRPSPSPPPVGPSSAPLSRPSGSEPSNGSSPQRVEGATHPINHDGPLEPPPGAGLPPLPQHPWPGSNRGGLQRHERSMSEVSSVGEWTASLPRGRHPVARAGSDREGHAAVSPAPGSRQSREPQTLEAQLSRKLQEYFENRSITNVVPVDNPLASNEPELLDMSPEQAEETQLKLQEMEREVRLATQTRLKLAEGYSYCCCTVVLHSYVIPSYVRTWDL